MPDVPFKIQVKGFKDLKKAIDEKEKRILFKSSRFREALAEKGADFAWKQFENAKYDGYVDDIEVNVGRAEGNSVAIIASGEAVKYIEYGAGVSSSSPDYWFFSDKGRDIILTAGGANAHYTRYKRDEYGDRIESDDSSWEKTEYETESVEKPHSYITGGNLPNHCMRYTAEYLKGEIIPTAKEIGLIK